MYNKENNSNNLRATMINYKLIECIVDKIREFVPKEIHNFKNDIENKIRQLLQAKLTSLNLVSREEFDVQSEVLLRTKEKLIILDQRLSKLEKNNVNNKEINTSNTSFSIERD